MSIPEFVSDKSLTLYGMFEAQVEKTPEAIALVFEQEQLTYRGLNERANQLAHYLRSLNVAPEMLVGICLERSIEMIVGMLGILKAGGAFVPLDPSQPQERLAFILADTKVEILLTLKKLVAGISVPQGHLVCLDTECENIATESKNNPKSSVQSENLAYTIYTSGSTGQPKGVMVNHQAICQGFVLMQEIFPITQQDRFLQKMPLTFDFSFWELFWPLMTGACVVLAQPGGEKDSAYVVKLIAQQEISILVFVPSALQVFLSEEGLKTCKNIRMVFTGGEPLTSALKDRFFNQLPNCRLYDLFGATENIIVTYWPCQPEEKLYSFPQGRPFPYLSLYVVDEQLQPVPVGETGELLVGGWGLARGYLNRPELTAQKFISNPFKDKIQERLYRTGDKVRYLSDGTIEILGRIDNQVKVRGFRIELGEIEGLLAKHPTVRESAVIATEDVPGNKRLIAYVVPYESELANQLELTLRNYLKENLPDYMMPAVIVMLDEMPLLPNGKVDRRALPTPGKSRPELEGALVMPQSDTEKLIAGAWQDVLQLEEVGIHDNFFELGGNSLLLIQVQKKLIEIFGSGLPTVTLFQYPTIHTLAQHLSQTQAEKPTVTRHKSSGRRTQQCSDIAIIGMSGRFPGAENIEAFWQNLRDGVESISLFSDEEIEIHDLSLLNQPNYVNAGATLPNIKEFDAEFFGYSAREAEIMDPQQRIFLECAWEALENAGYNPKTYEGLVGVYAGSSMSTYLINNVCPSLEISPHRPFLSHRFFRSAKEFQVEQGNGEIICPCASLTNFS